MADSRSTRGASALLALLVTAACAQAPPAKEAAVDDVGD